MLQAYVIPLSRISSLKYKGRVLRKVYGNWAMVILDLSKTQRQWVIMLQILVQ